MLRNRASSGHSALTPLPKWPRRWVLVFSLLLLGLVYPSSAQEPQSGFAGTVTAIVSGEPISGAKIEIGAVQALTDSEGKFGISVPPGVYALHVQAPGHIGMTQTLQRCQEGALTRVDFAMIPEHPTPAEEAIIEAKLLVTHQPSPSSQRLSSLAATAEKPEVTSVPKTVSILMPDDTVVVMAIDEYLKGVVPHEMAPYWPMEALKAQAVAARSYAATAKKFLEKGADVDTTTRSQVWSPTHYDTSDWAVRETHNEVITHNEGIIHAFFFASCDGQTRSSEEVWSEYLPYTRSVPCIHKGPSLYGHGVGMCQQGARAYAKADYTYRQILTHYYTEVSVTTHSPPQLTEGRVSPETGDTSTLFIFQVVYADEDGDIPQVADIYIDGSSHVMTYIEGHHRSGALYEYATALPPGKHSFSFSFQDGYHPAVNTPIMEGPGVSSTESGTPVPSPTPPPFGTRASTLRQTTLADFSQGSFSNTTLTSIGQDATVTLDSQGLTGIYTSPILDADFPFIAVGAKWEARLPEGASLEIQLRSGADKKTWSDWVKVPLSDVRPYEGSVTYGDLLFLRGRFLNYRLIFATASPDQLPRLEGLTLVYIDSRSGPTVMQARAATLQTATEGQLLIIPRSAWGADESLMFWPPEHRPVRKLIIHHTATSNYDLDPAATVRAIYYYHAVTLGWGDIGYNYLIDQQGNIYDGRYGGEGVAAGHAERYNWGSIGVALLGDYDVAAVPAPARSALVELLAWKGNRHFIDPLGSDYFIDHEFPNIVGHRELLPTTCPGGYLQAWLPQVRQAAYQKMLDIPPYVEIAAPAEGEVITGEYQVEVLASPAVVWVGFYLDGEPILAKAKRPFVWPWDTTALEEGEHELKVTVRTEKRLEASSAHRFSVHNRPPEGSLSAPAFVNTQSITLTLSALGADRMQFSNAWFWEGEDMPHEVGDVVDDAEANNGRAWRARAGADPKGALYGPYTYALPAGAGYRAYFRLKVGDNSSTEEVAKLDVVDNGGQRVLGELSLRGVDFSQPNKYQEAFIDFTHEDQGEAGLEFRLIFQGFTDVYLDRILLFSAPKRYAPTATWKLTPGEGPKEVAARYLDQFERASPPYTVSITLDQTVPEWLSWSSAGAEVQDILSGLETESARYSFSSDGGNSWSQWHSALATGGTGTTQPQRLLPADVVEATHLRFHIGDRAGNVSQSPAYAMSLTPLPTPQETLTPTPETTVTSTVTPTGTTPLDLSLQVGWNLIGLALETGHSASSLLKAVDEQGGHAVEIDRWRQGGWTVHLKGLPLNDFPLNVGEGYFLRTDEASILHLLGKPPLEPIEMKLEAGWSLLSLPQGTTIERASDLASQISAQGGDCQEIDQWYAGGWRVHKAGLPFNDFPIVPGEGYFVRCEVPCAFRL